MSARIPLRVVNKDLRTPQIWWLYLQTRHKTVLTGVTGLQINYLQKLLQPPVAMGVFKVYCSRYTFYMLYVIYNGHLLVVNKTDFVQWKNKLFISKTFKNNTFRAVIIVPWNWCVSHCQNLIPAPSIDLSIFLFVTHFPWQYLQNQVRVIHFRMNLQSFTPGSEWPVFLWYTITMRIKVSSVLLRYEKEKNLLHEVTLWCYSSLWEKTGRFYEWTCFAAAWLQSHCEVEPCRG